jgi:hypothetical protein
VVKLLLVLSDPGDLFVAEMTLAAGEFEPAVPVQFSNAQNGALELVAQNEEPTGSYRIIKTSVERRLLRDVMQTHVRRDQIEAPLRQLQIFE